MRLVMLPNTNMVSHSFYTQSAFRFGDYYGHMALFPVEDDMKNHAEKVKSSDSREVLRDWLEQYFSGRTAKYEFKVRPKSLLVEFMNTHRVCRYNWERHPNITQLRTDLLFGTKSPHHTRQ